MERATNAAILRHICIDMRWGKFKVQLHIQSGRVFRDLAKLRHLVYRQIDTLLSGLQYITGIKSSLDGLMQGKRQQFININSHGLHHNIEGRVKYMMVCEPICK